MLTGFVRLGGSLLVRADMLCAERSAIDRAATTFVAIRMMAIHLKSQRLAIAAWTQQITSEIIASPVFGGIRPGETVRPTSDWRLIGKCEVYVEMPGLG